MSFDSVKQKPKKPRKPRAVDKQLEDVLKILRTSPRFEMMQSVPFLQFAKIPGIEADSLGKVVNEKINVLKSLPTNELKQVTKSLRALVADVTTENADSEPLRGPALIAHRMQGWYEAKVALTDALELIRSKDIAEYANTPLVKVWESDWVRAPFEESLTVRQIAAIDIENLIKKRSMTSDKMFCIAKAIQKIAGEKSKKRSYIEDDTLPVLVRGAVREFYETRDLVRDRSDLFTKFFCLIPELISQKELAILYSCSEYGEEVAAKLFQFSSAELIAAKEKLKVGFEKEAHELAYFWRQLPDLTAEAVLKSISTPPELYLSAIRMVLYSLNS